MSLSEEDETADAEDELGGSLAAAAASVCGITGEKSIYTDTRHVSTYLQPRQFETLLLLPMSEGAFGCGGKADSGESEFTGAPFEEGAVLVGTHGRETMIRGCFWTFSGRFPNSVNPAALGFCWGDGLRPFLIRPITVPETTLVSLKSKVARSLYRDNPILSNTFGATFLLRPCSPCALSFDLAV
jgi:hypothetical protein